MKYTKRELMNSRRVRTIVVIRPKKLHGTVNLSVRQGSKMRQAETYPIL
jgi:hypothetical protein